MDKQIQSANEKKLIFFLNVVKGYEKCTIFAINQNEDEKIFTAPVVFIAGRLC